MAHSGLLSNAFFVSLPDPKAGQTFKMRVQQARAGFERRNPGHAPTHIFTKPGDAIPNECDGLPVVTDVIYGGVGVGVISE